MKQINEGFDKLFKSILNEDLPEDEEEYEDEEEEYFEEVFTIGIKETDTTGVDILGDEIYDDEDLCVERIKQLLDDYDDDNSLEYIALYRIDLIDGFNAGEELIKKYYPGDIIDESLNEDYCKFEFDIIDNDGSTDHYQFQDDSKIKEYIKQVQDKVKKFKEVGKDSDYILDRIPQRLIIVNHAANKVTEIYYDKEQGWMDHDGSYKEYMKKRIDNLK